jgi:DNA polymerase-3 subunit chi
MTERVDFYVLSGAGDKQRLAFACRLTEKAYLKDLRVVINNDSLSEAQLLDDMLWTFNDRSFVPHQLLTDEGAMDPATQVRLAVDPAAASADLLVNLAARLPADWQSYPRIAEIIDADAERRRLGRERFKTYRDLKVTLQTHQLTDAAEI